MNQVNFAEQARPRLKKSVDLSKRRVGEMMPQKKEYYTTIHNKIKVEYRNRQYKNVYEKLLKMDKPDSTYLPLYLQDLASSVSKMLREYITHKEVHSNSNLQACIHQGKDTIQKLYKQFIVDDGMTSDKKSVNLQLQSKMTRFYIVTVAFILKLAFIYVSQGKYNMANQLYEIGYSICLNIMTSSTSNYKMLRKVGHFFLGYASYLIDNKKIDKAISILFQSLKNETNIVIILSCRLKTKSKSESKQRKLQLYNRLYAIFYNLTVCFQFNNHLHWCYVCLKQCEILSELKVALIEKDIKINWFDTLKNYKTLYNQYREITKITETYFSIQEIMEDIHQKKIYQLVTIHQAEQVPNKNITQNTLNSIPQITKPQKRQNKRQLRRSVSLQDKLDHQSNKRIFKDFGQQILFYGVNLFDKDQKKKKGNSTVMKLRSHNSQTNQQLSKTFFMNQNQNMSKNKEQSKLKKKYKPVQNNIFRKIRQPMQFDLIQKRIGDLWIQEEKQRNKSKQKIYLLKYKSQYLNYKQIAKENKNIHEQIQIWNRKSDNSVKEKKKSNEQEEQQKQKGIDLFKKMILKHSKKFQIKKSQTFNILKKKRRFKCDYKNISYTQPQVSVNFLLDKLRKEKEKVTEKKQKKIQDQRDIQIFDKAIHKGKNFQNVFLTKDTVEIPNLFLSYIASSAFSGQVLKTILSYGFGLIKQN